MTPASERLETLIVSTGVPHDCKCGRRVFALFGRARKGMQGQKTVRDPIGVRHECVEAPDPWPEGGRDAWAQSTLDRLLVAMGHTGPCKQCRASLWFIATTVPREGWVRFNLDGELHAKTCPARRPAAGERELPFDGRTRDVTGERE